MHRIALFLLVVALLLPPGASAAPAPPDPRFGIVETFVNPEAATAAGAGYSRIILRWDVIQPAGPADWKPANVPDPAIAAELDAGREVVAVLIGTPTWASAQGGQSSRDVPDMFHWEQFVRRMAQHYRGRISHWIIWNEPDVWDTAHPGSTWAGTEEDYYRLLRTAYLAIKGVDPDQEVLLAGMTYYWDWAHGRRRYLDRLLEVIAADPEAAANGYYFDAVLYHLYFNPNQTVDVLRETRQTLARYGIAGKDIWINETNAPPADDPQEPPWAPARFPISQKEQAAFILQEYALAFSSGAARVEVYKLRNSTDHPESIEPFGLLRADDSRRPAFAAYQVATTYLGGFRSALRETQGDATAVTFDRDTKTTTVLWNAGRRPLRVAVRAVAREGKLVDEAGNATTVRPTGGFYRLDLPSATCKGGGRCPIGGAPRLLVEEAPSNGRRALAVSSAPRPTPTPVR